MAYTELANFSITLQDELGVEASNTYYALLDTTQTIADLIAAQNSLIGVVDAITDGKVIRSGITILPALPGGIKASAVAGATQNSASAPLANQPFNP